MVWVIVLIWVLIVVAFIVYVLRLARGESANRAFSQSLNDRVRRGSRRQREREGRLPRIAGGRLSFIPNPDGSVDGVEEDRPRPIKCPVHVNSPFVVEMRALLTSESTDKIELWQTNEGRLVTPLKPNMNGGTGEFARSDGALQTGKSRGKTQDTVGHDGGGATEHGGWADHGDPDGSTISSNQAQSGNPASADAEADPTGGKSLSSRQVPEEPVAVTSDVMPAVKSQHDGRRGQ